MPPDERTGHWSKRRRHGSFTFSTTLETAISKYLRSGNPAARTREDKTCATYYDQHVPESSDEIPGHSVAGVTYRHYAHRKPLAFKAIMTIPQPSAFQALSKGFDGECPCCRRRFSDAAD